MAVGDTIISMNAVPNGGWTTYQPAAGVEIFISNFAVDQDKVSVALYDGSQIAYQYYGAGSGNPEKTGIIPKCWISNSVYWRIYNNTTGTRGFYYCGIQTK